MESAISTTARNLLTVGPGCRNVALTDGELLDRFVAVRDEAAFESLLHRHGPMVLGVCRRTLNCEADAEDAFQATFLVLVRKAASIRPRSMVGNWLYGVAHTTALKARAMRTHRTRKELFAAAQACAACIEPHWDDLRPVIDRELNALPDKYRAPIVLCDLEGRSHKDAARELGCPLGTIGTRVSRGRVLLARRLTRHGVVPSAALLALLLSQNAATAGVSASLASSTLGAAAAALGSAGAAGSAISAHVATLTAAVLQSLMFARLRIALFVVVAAIAVGLTGGAAARELKSGGWSAFGESGQTEAQQFAGPWVVAMVLRQGEPLSPALLAKYGEWTFDVEELIVRSTARGAGSFRFDATKSLPEIDIAFANVDMPHDLPPLAGAGIYALQCNTLTLCLADPRVPAAARPTDFTSKPDDPTTTAFILHRKSSRNCFKK